MKVLILGGDGYLGWPTAMYLAARGHNVHVMDDYSKREIEVECGVRPLAPVAKMDARAERFRELTGKNIKTTRRSISMAVPKGFDVIIHYAEQPSAPYSMISHDTAVQTQIRNIMSTLAVLWAIKGSDTHLIKLGTMGEYGTPDIDIEEGWLDVEHKGRMDRMLFPKQPGSWYHASKVHDSVNIELACRLWGIHATDLNQGVVYGIETEETQLDAELNTSFHYDHIFGTCLNRFIVQAVAGLPLTVYGKGGQTRGWLNIKDTLRCVELAMLNPAKAGEFRVMNQFTEQFSVLELAQKVSGITGAKIEHIDNPRKEKEAHYYNAKHTALMDLGLKPHLLTDAVLESMIGKAWLYPADKSLIMPKVSW